MMVDNCIIINLIQLSVIQKMDLKGTRRRAEVFIKFNSHSTTTIGNITLNVRTPRSSLCRHPWLSTTYLPIMRFRVRSVGRVLHHFFTTKILQLSLFTIALQSLSLMEHIEWKIQCHCFHVRSFDKWMMTTIPTWAKWLNFMEDTFGGLVRQSQVEELLTCM